jgi:hypothetical protein
MRDQRPIRTARRKIQRTERERLGLTTTPCVLCIVDHHTGGFYHDSELTTPLCKFHHRAIHEQMLRSDGSLSFEPKPAKRVAMALRLSAVYDRARADAMDRWADLLDPPEGES